MPFEMNVYDDDDLSIPFGIHGYMETYTYTIDR